MIYDSLENLSKYGQGALWKSICETLAKLDKKLEDGTYLIEEGRAFLRVMSRDLLPAAECKTEGHRANIDIHVSLDGTERMDIFLKPGRQPVTPYDENDDTEFYSASGLAPVTVYNAPGFFTMLFPQDLHRTLMESPGSSKVKKAVIKILLDDYIRAE